ncbi:hypothetical protein [Streptomyces sp. WAC01526]|uniref:hypothetical protein n=1 Tax=Streptomyces sp. WAC01526 TaxID=2588709 RepID=UPI0011E04E44|nr:hypothetical protein [Streptomyces sp. WAC01526]
MGLTVRQVVCEVVAATASEELPLIEGMRDLDDAAVDRTLLRRGRSREPLGFGLEMAVALVTPVLWGVLAELAKKTMSTVGEKAAPRLRSRVRGLFQRSGAPTPLQLPSLSQEQIVQVRDAVLERCAAAGVEEPRSLAVADGVAARLALDALPDGGLRQDAETDGAPDQPQRGQGE